MASATEIKQFQLPNDTTKYDLIAKNGIFYIEGTGTTAGTWLGSHADIAEYYEGLTVAYKVPVKGASTTTLNINGLGAAKVVKQVSTAVSTSYGVNAVVLLIYTLDSTTAYWKVADYSASGDITGVTAGAGLTGGGSSGSVTLNVGAGSGIIVNDNDVAVNTSYTTSGKNYKVAVDSTTGGLYVNVPWTDTDTVYTLPTAGSTLGGVKTTSTVTSTSGLTACPIISGVPYYKDTNTANTDTTYDLAASKSSTNGNVKLNLTAGGSGSGTDSVTIKGSGATTVTTDANGVVTISSTDTNTQAVSSVNGKTGAVSLTYTDVSAASASHTHAASDITSGTLAAARLPAATATALGGVKIGDNINVSSGTISISAANTSTVGVAKLHKAEDCTGYTSDDGGATPAAVKKAVSLFGDNLYVKKVGDTITGNILFSNTASAQSGQPNIKWKTIKENTPFMGFATDQSDGTFVLASLKGTNYASGLAIGGGSGNLLWKGTKVATVSDIVTYSAITNAQIDSICGASISNLSEVNF